MGYNIIGLKKKDDDESVVSIMCNYAYQPVFKKCFGKDICEFYGRVTKDKIVAFENGVNNFIYNNSSYMEASLYAGCISNCTYENLCKELQVLVENMKNKNVKYLIIG